MMRYLKILYLFWSTAIAAEMEYRANFVLTALSSLGGLQDLMREISCGVCVACGWEIWVSTPLENQSRFG